MTVDVRISPVVREFIICTTGDDLIIPRRDDWLWLILKQHLLTAPPDYTLIPDAERRNYIRVMLLDCHSSKVYAKDRGRNIHINTLFRWYLDDRGQNAVARHLRSQFKATFHNFVQGAATVNPDAQITDAIHRFCKLYNITMNNITFDMLIKSWQRSEQRKYIKGTKAQTPIFY
jgi:hypothetical protein